MKRIGTILSDSFEFADMSSFLRAATGDVVGITTDKYPNGKTKISMPYNVMENLNGKAKNSMKMDKLPLKQLMKMGLDKVNLWDIWKMEKL